MPYELSPQSEQYLSNIVAGGKYPSKQDALEAAVAALREKSEVVPAVPEAHMALVEKAASAAEAGQLRPLMAADWTDLRQFAHDVASRSTPGAP